MCFPVHRCIDLFSSFRPLSQSIKSQSCHYAKRGASSQRHVDAVPPEAQHGVELVSTAERRWLKGPQAWCRRARLPRTLSPRHITCRLRHRGAPDRQLSSLCQFRPPSSIDGNSGSRPAYRGRPDGRSALRLRAVERGRKFWSGLGAATTRSSAAFHRPSSGRIVRGRERTAFWSISPPMRNCSLVGPDADCTGTEPVSVIL